MVVSSPWLLPVDALSNIPGQVSLSTCVRGALEDVPRGGIAGVWDICPPHQPHSSHSCQDKG